MQRVFLIKLNGSKEDFRYRAVTENNTRRVYLTVRGEAAFVEFAEVHISAQMLTLRVAVEADGVSPGHVGGETHYLDEGAAMGLLRLGARIGHLNRHGTLALASINDVENLVA